MQTHFTERQLADPGIQEANSILRSCVHCGFCLPTCPTYALLGDERDSPRGRIYLIKDMLESDAPPTPEVVHHVDRCLSCLACMTACPSGVHYQHYVDHARAHIEKHYRRPAFDRFVRAMIGAVLPHPGRLRAALGAAVLARPFSGLLGKRLGKMVALAPGRPPRAAPRTHVYPAEGTRRLQVALLPGCVQEVMRPAINDAAIRLLTRLGCEVVVAPATECCGALTHHLGRSAPAAASAAANVAAWTAELRDGGLDAVVSTAAGCGTVVKDYGHMLETDDARRIAGLARDVTEVVAELAPLPGVVGDLPVVAYQDACSLRHGQGVTGQPRELLRQAGFTVRDVAEPGMCCGSAGSYNILQPDIADALRDRKAANIAATGADVMATGNIGCLVQLRGVVDVPVAHTVELLDWATGGPPPHVLTS